MISQRGIVVAPTTELERKLQSLVEQFVAVLGSQMIRDRRPELVLSLAETAEFRERYAVDVKRSEDGRSLVLRLRMRGRGGLVLPVEFGEVPQ